MGSQARVECTCWTSVVGGDELHSGRLRLPSPSLRLDLSQRERSQCEQVQCKKIDGEKLWE